ncbi:HTH_Tnp_Tc3_2 domain-containing protein [Trichonephila clavipes]|nr:HTH_Tnp_Tc3_2 domain-containing protein [Trichonephila clavipes]
MSSDLVPLKTHRVEAPMHVKYVDVQISSHWCSVKTRKEVPSRVSSSSLGHGSKGRDQALVLLTKTALTEFIYLPSTSPKAGISFYCGAILADTNRRRKDLKDIKIDPKLSAVKLAAETSRIMGRSVSAETVRNVIRHAGYSSRVARKKPFISLQNQKKRLEFAKDHQLKT